jgi:hypothetical protein
VLNGPRRALHRCSHSASPRSVSTERRSAMDGEPVSKAEPTPAGERVILAALRSQLARANDVLIAQQRAAGLVGQIRGLRYPWD